MCVCIHVKVKVILRPIVSRPVYLSVTHPSGTRDQFFPSFFCIENCEFLDVGHPLWREDGSVIYLYNCFGSESRKTQTIFFCLIWDTPNLEGQVPVFISPRNRVAKLYPRALGSLFVASYDSQDYGGGILTRLHTGKSEISLLYHI
jgi:hypothetical protein